MIGSRKEKGIKGVGIAQTRRIVIVIATEMRKIVYLASSLQRPSLVRREEGRGRKNGLV